MSRSYLYEIMNIIPVLTPSYGGIKYVSIMELFCLKRIHLNKLIITVCQYKGDHIHVFMHLNL
jgi:hypothetical protein